MKRIGFLLSFSALFLAGLFFNSCSSEKGLVIEKRHYGNGYYVHVNKGADKKSESADAFSVVATPAVNQTEQISVADNQSVAAVRPQEKNIPSSCCGTTQKKGPQQVFSVSQKPAPKNSPVAAKKHSLKKPTDTKDSKPAAGDVDQIILVLLAIFLSPLAVYLKEGATNRFWLDLVCWLLGGGLVFSPFFYGGALILFAIIFAVLIVLDVI
jgi:uncharacterized membrane protein YqaE (UPF0057 family)